MKKITKAFIFSIIFSLASSGLVSSSQASVTRGAVCPECEIGSVVLREITYSGWVTVDYQNCTKNKNYRDKVQERVVTSRFECNNPRCGIGSVSTRIDTRVLCTH